MVFRLKNKHIPSALKQTDYSDLEFKTTKTQKGLSGRDIITGGTAVIPGEGQTYEEAGVDPAEAKAYWKANPELFKEYLAKKEDKVIDRKRDVDIKPEKKYYSWNDREWTWEQFLIWNNKQGGGRRARENKADFINATGIRFAPPGTIQKKRRGSQNISNYTYKPRAQ